MPGQSRNHSPGPHSEDGKLRPREAMLIVAGPYYVNPRVCLAHQSGTALGPRKLGPKGQRREFQQLQQGSNSSACNGPESKREGNAKVFRAQGHTTGS